MPILIKLAVIVAETIIATEIAMRYAKWRNRNKG